jgi:PST family polysaccharide transporter
MRNFTIKYSVAKTSIGNKILAKREIVVRLRLLKLSKGVKETLHNIGWVSSDRVIRVGGQLIIGVWVVRYLGPHQWGLYSYAYAIFALFNIVSNLGLDYLVVRDIAIDPGVEKETEVLGTAFQLKVAASAVTTLAAIIYAWIVHPHEALIVLIVAIISVAAISQGFDVIDYFFQAKVRSRVVVLPRLVIFIGISLARVIAIVTKCPLMVFVVFSASEMLLYELVGAVVYARRERNMRTWSFRWPRAVVLLKESWPLILAGLLVTIYMRSDQVILGTLFTPGVVGMYSAAVKLSETWYTVPVVISSSVMPRLVKHLAENPTLYYRRLQRFYDVMVILSFVAAILTTFFGKYLVLLAFGRAYLPAAKILSIHVYTSPFVFLGIIGSSQLIHERKTTIEVRRTLSGAVVNVALNILLVPHYGAIGSAIATLVAQASSAYFSDAFSQRTKHIFIMKSRALLCLWMFQRGAATVVMESK